jgi:DNA-binding NtrC family response regulator/tetratricopeptide (TPR) repeat protein
MGRVYLARDVLEGGRPVALKVYPSRYYDERLRREFLALRELRHPGVARAFHFGVSTRDRAPFFTLEYVEGRPLGEHLARERGPGAKGRPTGAAKLAAALRLLRRTAAALAYLHRRGVLHLDIKPDNILVVPLGSGGRPQPVLIDFGLVRAVHARETPVGHATLPYAPPELFTGLPPSPASDVYSLAATFYRLLSGRPPVQGTDFDSYARAHRAGEVPPIPEVPAPLERLLLRALARDPRRRFEDGGDLERAVAATALPGASEAPEVLFHEPDFVGRARELAAARRWLENRDRRPILEVCAGGGWGKTRLLERIETMIETEAGSGARETLLLHCEPGEPIEMLARAARAAAVLEPASGRSEPAPARRRGAPGGASAADLEGRARETARSLAPLIALGAFLLIDDLHLAPEAGYALVEELARALSARGGSADRGGVVVAHRDSELRAPPRWREAGLAERLELGPLPLKEALAIDLEGVDGALAGRSGARVRRLKSALHREVGGHPLFYVRGLLDLAGDPGAAATLAPLERILAQLGRLDPAERNLAVHLALLGGRASAETLRAALSTGPPLGERRFATLALGLERGGLIARTGRGLRLVHESVADAICRSLPAARARELHAAISRRFEALAERSRRPGLLIDAAWHAGEAGELARAAATASRWLGHGAPPPETPADRASRVLARAAEEVGPRTAEGRRLLEAASDVLSDLGRYEESLEVLSGCATHRARGRGGAGRGRGGAVRVRGGAERGRGGAGLEERVRLSRKLGALAMRVGRMEAAMRHFSGSIAPAVERAAPLEALQAHAELALIRHFRGETDLALEHSDRGLRIWGTLAEPERAGMLPAALKLHGIVGQVQIRRLELDRAINTLEAGLRLAKRGSSALNMAMLLNSLALAHHLAGRFAVALATFRRAEAMARELRDQPALATIRSNVVQIHAKTGRFSTAWDLLEELEGSPAIAQSRRLRLGALFSRGLLLNLALDDADGVWAEVDRLGSEVGDGFLVGFARLYRAEGLIARGDHSAARRLLSSRAGRGARGGTDVIETLRASRRSLVEALSGRCEASRRLRRSVRAAARELPSLLSAWNGLFSGTAALETGDEREALEALEAARAIFERTGFAAGSIECGLALADLHLRAAAGDPRRLRRAEAEIRRASAVRLEAPEGASPRARDLRVALLEARLLLARAADFPPHTVEAGDLQREVSGLLARAAGDPALASLPDSRLVLELAAAAHARLLGDRDAARAAAARAGAALSRAARRLAPADRAAFLRRDPWQRFALEAHRPAPGRPRLAARQAVFLGRILQLLSSGAPIAAGETASGPLAAVAHAVAAAVGARRVEILAAGRAAPIVSWGERSPGRGPAAMAAASGIARSQPVAASIVRAERSRLRPFSAADEVFLDLVARALSPYLAAPWTDSGAGGGAGFEDTPRTGARPTDPLDSAPAGHRAGARSGSLTATRAVSKTAKLSSLARALKGEGVIVAGGETRRLLSLAHSLAQVDIPVLITGESGSGKDVAARLLHRLGPRAQGPYLSQSASALPEDLFEADLFGYEAGAFTGADQSRTGFLFRAAGGTFHLEEIGDLPLSQQQRLLRVIEEKAARPLGATSPRRLDVRFVASTHRDIDLMVRRGEFRRDLFFRLNGARLHVSPLRQRVDEIPALAQHFWREYTGSPARFPASTLEALAAHDWPGNVRELLTVLRRLSLEVSGTPSSAEVREALGQLGQLEPRGIFSRAIFEAHRYGDLLRSLETSYLEHLLHKHGGDLERIATELGTTTRSIYRRFERLGLKPAGIVRRSPPPESS